MKLNQQQIDALNILNEAIRKATDTGLFDEMVINCDSPDSINDVCAAVAYMLEEA